jgi:vacuolar-type H+-ATPase subunit H
MSETRDTLPTSGDAFPAATSTPTGSLGATGSAAPSTGTSNLDTAKREAGSVVDTAKDQAAGVAATAKEEAKEVGREAKAQVSRLYDNARQELRSQAESRQTQLADGLRSAGDELRGLAEGRTDVNQGMATDIVRQVSDRLDGAASWLGSRDPGAVLDEVKRYARRRPVVFLAVAALAGVVVGRLTRAVTAGAPDTDMSGRQLTTGYGSGGNGTPAPAYGTGATYGAGTGAYGAGAAYGTGAAGTTPGAYDTDAAGGLGGATAVGDTPSQRLRSSGSGDEWEVNPDDRRDTV